MQLERTRDDLVRAVGEEDDVAVAAITVAELLVAVELADARRREYRRTFVDQLLETLRVESYDLDVAEVHAALLAQVSRVGTRRGAHDLIIAATAVARRRELVTADMPGFRDLTGLVVRALG